MRIHEAKQVAREWVLAHARAVPGVEGAFFHGSVNWLADDAILPSTSDVDVMLVLSDDNPPPKPGKLLHKGLLLEVSHVPAKAVQSAPAVLTQYNLAGSFHRPSVIHDPTGHLARLNRDVAAEYARRPWVQMRAEQALRKYETGLARLKQSDPLHDQVMTWLFGTGVMTHVLLVAGLRNPTVRTRYAAARELLAEYGGLDFYRALVGLLGCEDWTAARAEKHLERLVVAFDSAAHVIRTPFPFASDISGLARPLSIDGSGELIAAGLHREAVFWLVATFSRCMAVYHHDAPATGRIHDESYRLLLRDLGIESYTDMRRRADQAMAMRSDLLRTAEEILAANPDIED